MRAKHEPSDETALQRVVRQPSRANDTWPVNTFEITTSARFRHSYARLERIVRFFKIQRQMDRLPGLANCETAQRAPASCEPMKAQWDHHIAWSDLWYEC